MKKRGSKKKRKRQNDNSKLIYLFTGAVLLLGSLLYLLSGQKIAVNYDAYINKGESRPQKAINYAAIPATLKNLPQPERAEVSASTLPKLAIIIDDIGFNKRYIDLIDVDIPVTMAIIPFTPYSLEAAEKGKSVGLEIMLHLPMEPKDYPGSNPGKGALLTSMKKGDILKQLRLALEAVPNISGVNNHMGSQFTEYPEGMKIVLEEVKKRGLFFIDSKTSNNSRGYSIAQEMDIKTAERSVFLDNVQSEDAIRIQLAEAVKIAKKNGEAVAIGHPYQSTISVLKKIAPNLKKEGVELVLASALAK